MRPFKKPEPPQRAQKMSVILPAGGTLLAGDLYVPAGARGIVIFAHGSGSSRFSPRNRYVAGVLNEHGIGTLLIDLLNEKEERVDEQTRQLRFDIPLLAERLTAIGEWVLANSSWQTLKIGYFGASTGGAAALAAAARRPDRIAAVVSRGGRPDLASDDLPDVEAPVLLIVGENDEQVLAWNQEALALLNADSRLSVIPGATHLFEEPGTLDAVAHQAADWFILHFQSSNRQQKENRRKEAS
ncbi:MAG: dienelactone hydrolase family protein [Alphaproteobacteria bacterium]|nr:dienelactone hydrolase family protein [Alphaproteobacteria bacterium]